MKIASILLSSVFLMCIAARANTIQFTLTSNGITGSGTLSGVVDPYNSSALDITSATGTFGTDTLSLITPSGNTHTAEEYFANPGDPYPYVYDNVLFLTGTAVDNNGILFRLSGGSSVLNLYSASGGYWTSAGTTSTYNPVYSAKFSFTSVPEPSTVILLGLGLALIFGSRRLQVV